MITSNSFQERFHNSDPHSLIPGEVKGTSLPRKVPGSFALIKNCGYALQRNIWFHAVRGLLSLSVCVKHRAESAAGTGTIYHDPPKLKV